MPNESLPLTFLCAGRGVGREFKSTTYPEGDQAFSSGLKKIRLPSQTEIICLTTRQNGHVSSPPQSRCWALSGLLLSEWERRQGGKTLETEVLRVQTKQHTVQYRQVTQPVLRHKVNSFHSTLQSWVGCLFSLSHWRESKASDFEHHIGHKKEGFCLRQYIKLCPVSPQEKGSNPDVLILWLQT